MMSSAGFGTLDSFAASIDLCAFSDSFQVDLEGLERIFVTLHKHGLRINARNASLL